MKSMTSARRKFKARLDTKQDISRPIPALMGNGAGTIEVPGQPVANALAPRYRVLYRKP
jgi:hypothetical protein